VAPLLDAELIRTEFCGAVNTHFCFSYLLEGVTTVLQELQARLCYVFFSFVMIKL